MTFLADIYGPPSTEATANGQPSKVPILIVENEKCRVSAIGGGDRITLQDRFLAGQFQTLPVAKVTFRLGIGLKENYWIQLKNHPDLSKLKIISKVPIHQNSTSEIAFCSQ